MNILVVGGAGYIGSHMVKALGEAGHSVMTVDNLSTGHADAVQFGELVVMDLQDRGGLFALFGDNQFDAVIHFAASSLVGESVNDPGLYYKNNVGGTLNLLDAMVAFGCKKIVFSSTAAVYGDSMYRFLSESEEVKPINPYGRSKMMVEQIMADYHKAHGLDYVALRYFNAAGAAKDGSLTERHEPETHLIPIVLEVAEGKRKSVQIYGGLYPTQDGTCVRDFVHVVDLCEAHALAVDYLMMGGGPMMLNLGSGQETSVLEVVESVERVTNKKIPYQITEKREGDPTRLVANITKATKVLGWLPKVSVIDTIIQDAWNAKG
jgi:UDP-glucose 4-epimerase